MSISQKSRRRVVGLIGIAGALSIGVTAAHRQLASEHDGLMAVSSRLASWMMGRTTEVSAESAWRLELAPNDPVFVEEPGGGFRQVGRVRNHFGQSTMPTMTNRATVILDSDALGGNQPQDLELHYYMTPTSLDWVAKTLISPERNQEIKTIIANDWNARREKVLEALQPVIEEAVRRTRSTVEAELPTVLKNHRAEFARIADRYQTDVVRQRIVPLVRKHVVPIVEEEVRPVAMSLGKDLWNRVSLWSFTWRYLYDVSPLPERNALQSEFDRFLVEEVRPALDSRSDEFVKVTERILARTSRNEEIRTAVRESLRSVATDAEVQALVWNILKEGVLENATLRASLREYLSSEEVRVSLQKASSEFEPTARAIGDAVFGSRDAGITSAFARAMRVQILQKDRRWLILRERASKPNGQLEIVPGADPMDFPLEFRGTEPSPLTPTETSLPATL